MALTSPDPRALKALNGIPLSTYSLHRAPPDPSGQDARPFHPGRENPMVGGLGLHDMGKPGTGPSRDTVVSRPCVGSARARLVCDPPDHTVIAMNHPTTILDSIPAPSQIHAHRDGGRHPRPGCPDGIRPAEMARTYADYLAHLASRGFAPPTVKNRRLSLLGFIRWCRGLGIHRPREVTPAVLEGYRAWLRLRRKTNGTPLAPITQRERLFAVHDYMGWLCSRGALSQNPAEGLELPRPGHPLPLAPLSDAQIERVLALPETATPLGLRDRAILETLYSTGIRRRELTRLSTIDLDPRRRILFVRQGKGRRDRVVPLGDRALGWVVRYLGEVRPTMVVTPQEEALFLPAHGEGTISPAYLSRLVTGYLRRAGIRRGGCHRFRHACATLMLENGADIRFIQQLLGHASLATTQIYTHVSIRQLQRVHDLTHPASRRRRKGALAAPCVLPVVAIS